MRTPIMAGNWKMNKGPREGGALAQGLVEALTRPPECEVVLAPPFVTLAEVARRIAGSPIKLAAQNMHWEASGAYTGEISGPMLAEVGCEYVIIGHSERRQYFEETDEAVNFKIKAALSHGLKAIVCIGESLEEREAGDTMRRVEIQLRGGLAEIADADMDRIVLAYEPIWAIGTGRTATSGQAQEVHAFIREVLARRFSDGVAEGVRIQYGGSVKPGNVAELMAQPDIDGALVGGASLTADSFAAIVRNGVPA